MKGASYKQLQVFHAIVQEGSIQGAARRLEMAPPSVSQALKLLEKNVGLSLFNRSTRKIELTEAGRVLQTHSMAAMDALEYALQSVQELSHAPSGKLRVTLPKFVYQTYLKHCFAAFCRQYPHIELELSLSDATVDIVQAGIDLGIRFGHKVEAGMVAKQLTAALPEALFASPDYLARNGMPTCIEDLQQHKLIQYRFISSNQYARLMLRKDEQDVQVSMSYALVVNDTDVMIDAAEAGLGIGRMVLPAVQDKFDKGSLVPVLPDYWPRFAGLSLYFSRDSQRLKRLRVFIDFLLDYFEKIA